MSGETLKLLLANRIPREYNQGVIAALFREIETLNNRQVDGRVFPVTSVTADYTATDNDCLILADATSGAITVTLRPADQSKEKLVIVKKTDNSVNAVTIDGNGSETIDGATTVALSSQWNFRGMMSNATAWFVVSTS